ncbi:uncharacterized protein F5891DRAFT_984895 [Suillus fuscotomentosus]|uniref:Uncharacterized protein n=1 Tax=Suillus fuscotomentosus TaxID=1912939 RepID=A0AAD4DV98_9AGAM|nr:uncharacterized protein F5891DRAFT_984895 [Suillus fuscotomentosus]KAG1894623.1 hypothetical protein F5891DRAFT_984895 [Suillus fuscotomentosus]
MTCHFALLHYDSVSKSMIEWYWPNNDKGKKVLLSNFEKYRKERQFRYPCCLCAEEGGRGAYMEAAVYSWRDKTTDKTYWNARCASDQCGYRGTCQYPRRDNVEEHKEPRPIDLEWTYLEQTELMKRLEFTVGDGITMLQALYASGNEADNEASHPSLFKRSAKAKGSGAGVTGTMPLQGLNTIWKHSKSVSLDDFWHGHWIELASQCLFWRTLVASEVKNPDRRLGTLKDTVLGYTMD